MDVSFHTCKYRALTEHKRFEISLNQSDDLGFAVSHFKSIKVPETAAQYKLHGVGSGIISEITRRVGSFLPQKQRQEKRRHEKKKATKSRHSRIAKTGGNAEPVERAEDRRASLVRALQDDHSSGDYVLARFLGALCLLTRNLRLQVFAEVNQPQPKIVHDSLSRPGPDSSHQGVPESYRNITPVHISQTPQEPDRTVASQQTMGSLGLSAHSPPNPSVRFSSPSPSEPAEQAVNSGIGSSGSTSSPYENAIRDAATSDTQGAGDLSNQLATAEQPLRPQDLQFESTAHDSYPTAGRTNAQTETPAPQAQAFSNYFPLNTINGTDNDISIEQNRLSAVSPENFLDPQNSAYMHSNTCLHGSQSLQPETSISDHFTPTCYQNALDALTPSNYGDLARVIHSQQSAGPVHSGFLDMSQAFQGFFAHGGFDDTTQAMNFHAESSDISEIPYNAGLGIDRPYCIGSLQAMDQVSSADGAGSRISLDGYHSISQAIEPLPP